MKDGLERLKNLGVEELVNKGIIRTWGLDR